MNNEELKEWHKLYKQFKNGYHMSSEDWGELVRLNHLVMEGSHAVHNHNMMNVRW